MRKLLSLLRLYLRQITERTLSHRRLDTSKTKVGTVVVVDRCWSLCHFWQKHLFKPILRLYKSWTVAGWRASSSRQPRRSTRSAQITQYDPQLRCWCVLMKSHLLIISLVWKFVGTEYEFMTDNNKKVCCSSSLRGLYQQIWGKAPEGIPEITFTKMGHIQTMDSTKTQRLQPWLSAQRYPTTTAFSTHADWSAINGLLIIAWFGQMGAASHCVQGRFGGWGFTALNDLKPSYFMVVMLSVQFVSSLQQKHNAQSVICIFDVPLYLTSFTLYHQLKKKKKPWLRLNSADTSMKTVQYNHKSPCWLLTYFVKLKTSFFFFLTVALFALPGRNSDRTLLNSRGFLGVHTTACKSDTHAISRRETEGQWGRS